MPAPRLEGRHHSLPQHGAGTAGALPVEGVVSALPGKDLQEIPGRQGAAREVDHARPPARRAMSSWALPQSRLRRELPTKPARSSTRRSSSGGGR